VATRRKISGFRLALSICLPLGVVSGLFFAVTAQAAPARPAERATTAPVHMSTALAAHFVQLATPTAAPNRLIITPRVPGAGLAIYPSAGATAPSQSLPAVDELGSPLTLLAIGRDGVWLQVLLPTRPNGSTGWVAAADVNTAAPANRVEVSHATHELRVVRISDGAVLVTSPAGFGSPSTPTPSGEFFVRDHFPTGSMNHPYGPFAFGLSGHSEVYQHFGTGDGRIAIHGTNQPSTIGADASNGCVHVPNDVVLQLVDLLPLGTPVVIS
jgi:lipoprotein-anchoring transpeptidase ErfK/SrfK